MAQWKQELRDAKPDCVVSDRANRPLAKFVLDIYGKYTEHRVAAKPNLLVFCAQ
jgi:hypothetical protein